MNDRSRHAQEQHRRLYAGTMSTLTGTATNDSRPKYRMMSGRVVICAAIDTISGSLRNCAAMFACAHRQNLVQQPAESRGKRIGEQTETEHRQETELETDIKQ